MYKRPTLQEKSELIQHKKKIELRLSTMEEYDVSLSEADPDKEIVQEVITVCKRTLTRINDVAKLD